LGLGIQEDPSLDIDFGGTKVALATSVPTGPSGMQDEALDDLLHVARVPVSRLLGHSPFGTPRSG
jgi:hypothetical protein